MSDHAYEIREIRDAEGNLLESWREKQVGGSAWKIDGWSKKWFPSGSLRSIIRYVDGNAEGPEMNMDANGFIQYVRSYKNNEPNGYTFVFDKFGAFARMFALRKGVKHGTDVTKSSSGYTKATYRDGVLLSNIEIPRDQAWDEAKVAFREVESLLREHHLPFVSAFWTPEAD